MTQPLTDRQSQILGVLRQAIDEKGYPPSVREVGAAVGLAASSVARQLWELEAKGFIQRDPNKPRALSIVDPFENAPRNVNTQAIDIQAARAEGWREGHKTCTCQRPGAPVQCINPFEVA